MKGFKVERLSGLSDSLRRLFLISIIWGGVKDWALQKESMLLRTMAERKATTEILTGGQNDDGRRSTNGGGLD